MKNTLKLSLVALGAALFSLPALQADDRPAGPPPEGGGREMRRGGGERMFEQLGLSESQKTQIKALNEQEKAELDALRDGSGVSEDKRAKVDAIRKSYMDKRLALMTPEQQEKAKQMREKMGKRGGEGRSEGRPERREKPAN